ncbi:T-box transcription factor TBX18-like [Musca vetustissima]|uniref:T-box transcription factor TBX18-like n=1 Tax=Musca vetustissima TaxID=27455 RepID=UPI002AB7E778|nr:T-box transcription factor TBX18-like [Musca vetustissima]
MITMNELVDLRMQQHIAHEIYRQQIMQRIPDPFPPMMHIPMPRHVIMPPRVTLPGVDVQLQNDELWKQFHQIGTEMIITKSGRRMFPSMRLSLSGLDDDTNYCVLLEMVPIGDCRYKFSGSQWVPAGGAEPQSPQRMYLHPDSPATGSHWQAQPILFNKVKLTNNTLDNSGQIVLASMHKYQPRIHVIRTSDLAQIPWAPQQAFVFPETEFVAVTAYQNDRITKLKIDNNPFAKGFRETGQSRCKRKMSSSPTADEQLLRQQHEIMSPTKLSSSSSSGSTPPSTATTITTASSASSAAISESGSSICSDKPVTTAFFNDHIIVDMDAGGTSAQIKRLRSNDLAAIAALDPALHGSLDAGGCIAASPMSTHTNNNNGMETSSNHSMSSPLPLDYVNNSGNIFQQQAAAAAVAAIAAGHNGVGGGSTCNATSVAFMHHFQQNMQSLLRPSLVDLACSYFGRPQPMYPPQHADYVATQQQQQHQMHHQHHESLLAAGLAAQQQPILPPTAPVAPLLPPLPQNLSLTAGGSDGGSGELLPNRVTAINSNTTSDCITNDADLSSSDSSLIQDDVTLPTTPTPVPTMFAGCGATADNDNTNNSTTAGSGCDGGCPSTNDALPQSPSCNSAQSNHPGQSNNNNSTTSNGRKKGFSISAILGGGS